MLMIILVILLPLNSIESKGQLISIPGDQFSKVGQDITQDITGQNTDVIGEDIIINVDQYQPTVLPTALVEDQGATVFALLKGTPTNPTIDIPSITRVVSQPVKITTIPPNKPVSLGPIQYIQPPRTSGGITYDNMGYLVIPIRRIPKEADVPDQIDVEMVSRIFFDVSAGLGFSSKDDVLTKQEYKNWLQEKDRHSFYAGYIRADDIQENKATIVVYDNNMNQVAAATVNEGSTSSIMNTYKPGFVSYSRVFDKFRISVNEIHGRNDKVSV